MFSEYILELRIAVLQHLLSCKQDLAQIVYHFSIISAQYGFVLEIQIAPRTFGWMLCMVHPASWQMIRPAAIPKLLALSRQSSSCHITQIENSTPRMSDRSTPCVVRSLWRLLPWHQTQPSLQKIQTRNIQWPRVPCFLLVHEFAGLHFERRHIPRLQCRILLLLDILRIYYDSTTELPPTQNPILSDVMKIPCAKLGSSWDRE